MATPGRPPRATAASLAGKKSVSPLPPNPCLLAIILTVSSSAGPRYVFHYPPIPSVFPRKPASSQNDADEDYDSHDDFGEEDSGLYGLDASRFEDESGEEKGGLGPGPRSCANIRSRNVKNREAGSDDDSDGDHDRFGSTIGMADVISSAGPRTDAAPSSETKGKRTTWQAEVIRKATKKLLGRRKRRRRREEHSVFNHLTDIEREEMDIRAYIPKTAGDRFGSGYNRLKEMSGQPGDANLAAWERVLGYPTAELAKLLSPTRMFDKKRFELGVDDLVFLGAPRFSKGDGRWSRRRTKGRRRRNERNHGSRGNHPTQNESESRVPQVDFNEMDFLSDSDPDGIEPGNRREVVGDDDDDDGGRDQLSPRSSLGIPRTQIDDHGMNSRSSLESQDGEMKMFNIVFVLNPPTIEHWIRIEEMYEHVVRKFSKVLKFEQAADDFVWRQAKEIWDLQDKAKDEGLLPNVLWQLLIDNSPLARAISTVYDAISTARIAHVNMTGRLDAYFQIPQAVSTSFMPTIMRPQIPGLWLTTTSMAHYGLGDPNDNDDVVLFDENGLELKRDLRPDPEFEDSQRNDIEGEPEGNHLEADSSPPSRSPEKRGSEKIPNVNSPPFEDDDQPSRPPPTLSPHAALLLLDEPAALLRQIRSSNPSALTDALTAFILLVSPTMSLIELATTASATRLAKAIERLFESDEFDQKSRPALFSSSTVAAASEISLREMQLLGQHLIYWRRARAIPPLHPRDTYIVSANANVRAIEPDAIRFALRFCGSVKASSSALSAAPEMIVPSLPELLEKLSGHGEPVPYGEIIGHDADRESQRLHMDVLAWLLRHGYVTQLRTFAWVLVPPAVKKIVHDNGDVYNFWDFDNPALHEVGSWQQSRPPSLPAGTPNNERERPWTSGSGSSVKSTPGPAGDADMSALSTRFQGLYSAVQKRIPWSVGEAEGSPSSAKSRSRSGSISRKRGSLIEGAGATDSPARPGTADSTVGFGSNSMFFGGRVVDEDLDGVNESTVVVSPLDASPRELAWLSKVGEFIGSGGLAPPSSEMGTVESPSDTHARHGPAGSHSWAADTGPFAKGHPPEPGDNVDSNFTVGTNCDDRPEPRAHTAHPQEDETSPTSDSDPVRFRDFSRRRQSSSGADKAGLGSVRGGRRPFYRSSSLPPSSIRSALEGDDEDEGDVELDVGHDLETDIETERNDVPDGTASPGLQPRLAARHQVHHHQHPLSQTYVPSSQSSSRSQSRRGMPKLQRSQTVHHRESLPQHHSPSRGHDLPPDLSPLEDEEHMNTLLAAATREFWPRLLPYLDGFHALEEVPLREGMNADLVADMIQLLVKERWLVVYRGW